MAVPDAALVLLLLPLVEVGLVILTIGGLWGPVDTSPEERDEGTSTWADEAKELEDEDDDEEEDEDRDVWTTESEVGTLATFVVESFREEEEEEEETEEGAGGEEARMSMLKKSSSWLSWDCVSQAGL